MADYVDDDLTGTEPALRPSASLEAVRADSMDQFGGGVAQGALEERRGGVYRGKARLSRC